MATNVKNKHSKYYENRTFKIEQGTITEIEAQTLLLGVSKRFSEMEEAGKEATSLIAHLKDQYGFNPEEEHAQDKIMEVFEYEGRW